KYSLPELVEETGLMKEIPYYVVKYPVFSTFALSGLDSKIGPEMKSTGEGIAIAYTKEEALAKAFLFLERSVKQNGQEVFVSPSISMDEALQKQLHDSGLQMADANNFEAYLKDKRGKVLLSINDEEQDARIKAAKYRLLTFSNVETFKAYLEGATIKEVGVNSLQEWQQIQKEGVEIAQ
ncbi:MAG: carbamoyl-phosphate synthase large subunit, partial [Bacillus sp. (in: firmicutes)]